MRELILKTVEAPEIEVNTHTIGGQNFIMPAGLTMFKLGNTVVGVKDHHVGYLQRKFGDLNSLEGPNLQKAFEFINAPKEEVKE